MKPIEIIGGGLAGLTLGIALQREGVPIVIWEAGDYPRHRVCGEFISGRGLSSLDRLGLLQRVKEAGAVTASTTEFFTSRGGRCGVRQLPQHALCISRHALDSLLAKIFCERGGDLRTNTRWTSPLDKEGVVRATGRRPQARAAGCRWYGLKAHVRNVKLHADLEMHFTAGGYVGLCRVADDAINVCGLFRRVDSQDITVGFDSLKTDARFSGAEWDEHSFCAVAGIPPFPQISRDGICIGDALAMPAPLTGNGMSMAFESAEISVEPLLDYARGTSDWDRVATALRWQLHCRFARRLRWSTRLHRLLFQPAVLRLMPLLLRTGPCWRTFFNATR